MTSARDRAAALRKRDAPPPAAEPEVPTERERLQEIRDQADARKVRQTVDLTRARHQALAVWRLETAVALGRTRLTTQDVLAAAVDLLLDDPTVARRIRAHLEEQM